MTSTDIIDPESTPTESIAETLLPYYTEGTKKAQYLKYIIAGFSKTEASKLCKLGKYPHKTVHRWEADPVFMALLEKSRTTLRDELSNKLVDIEFTRNFMLVLQKDFDVLFKDALGEEALTKDEFAYLSLIRKFYTPQQYAMIKQMAVGGGPDGAFDFTKTVLEIRLSKETTVARS